MKNHASCDFTARYTGASWGDAGNTFKVPAHTLMDLALRYDLGRANPAWKGWNASLNVRNLTDRYYVAACAFALGCNLGEGRTAMHLIGVCPDVFENDSPFRGL